MKLTLQKLEGWRYRILEIS